MINNEQKELVWQHMLSLPKSYRGNGLTAKRIEKLKSILWNDKDFWFDIISRHGIKEIGITGLMNDDPNMYLHCVGNFWGQLYQTAIEMRIVKI